VSPVRFRAPRRAAPNSERRGLARTQWTIARRIALVMSVITLLVGIIICSAMVMSQRAEAAHETQWGIEHNTVDSPPVCVWMTVERDGKVISTPGTPAGLPVMSSLNAVRNGAPPVLERVRRHGELYTVRTARRGAGLLSFHSLDPNCPHVPLHRYRPGVTREAQLTRWSMRA